MPSRNSLNNLIPNRPGEIRNKRGVGRIKSLTDCLITTGGEKHILKLPNGEKKEVTWNEYLASVIKRIIGTMIEKKLKGEKFTADYLDRACFEIYMSRMAPFDQAEGALSDTRTLTVVITRENEIVDVKPAMPVIDAAAGSHIHDVEATGV